MVNREFCYVVSGVTFMMGVISILNYSGYPVYGSLWVMGVALIYSKKKNHFVNLLLVLELLAIINIWLLATSLSSSSAAFPFILSLITIIVGGAGLGLGLLVKFVRLSCNELMVASNI